MIPRGYRLLVVFGVYLIGLVLLAGGLRLIGLSLRTAYYATALAGLALAYGSRLVDSFLPFAVGLIVMVVVIHGLRRSKWIDSIMMVVVIVIGLGPPLQWVTQFIERSPSQLSRIDSLPAVSAAGTRPNVWILVLDGYPSQWALANVFESAAPGLAGELEDAGFTANANALAPYPWTVAAVASVLDGHPVAPVGTRIGPSEMADVRKLLGGDAFVLDHLSTAGYDVAIIESGWHLSRCNGSVQACTPSLFYDEAVSTLWHQSALSRLGTVDPGSPFARGSLHTFQTLNERASQGSRDGPQVTFAHSLAPHPPLALTEDCELLASDKVVGGGVLGDVGFDKAVTARRQQGFLDQVACVDQLVLELVEKLPLSDAVVVFGDHGSDALGQSGLHPGEWSESMFKERHLTLAAIRSPGCGRRPLATTDLAALLLSCISESEIRTGQPMSYSLPNFKVDGKSLPVIEIPQATLESLIGIAASNRSR